MNICLALFSYFFMINWVRSQWCKHQKSNIINYYQLCRTWCASILLICLINWAKRAKTFLHRQQLDDAFRESERLHGQNPLSLFQIITTASKATIHNPPLLIWNQIVRTENAPPSASISKSISLKLFGIRSRRRGVKLFKKLVSTVAAIDSYLRNLKIITYWPTNWQALGW